MYFSRLNKSSITKKSNNVSLSGIHFRIYSVLIIFTAVWIIPVTASGKIVAHWDFSRGLQGWTGNNRVENLSFSQEGLIVKSTGQDPWIEGPAVDLPGDKIHRVKIRMKSNADSGAELFYGRTFRAGYSARFTARPDGQWHDYFLVIRDKLGPGTRFRLDPCIGEGEVTIAWITAEAINEMITPSLDKPREPDRTVAEITPISSGNLEFKHYGSRWGNFAFFVNGVEMAAGYRSELIGLLSDDNTEWLHLKNAKVKFDNQPKSNKFTGTAIIEDSRNGKWKIFKSVSPGEHPGTLIVEIRLKVNKDRDIIYIPWMTIFPGLGTFGRHKDQGLFAGVEYLCDESSSSRADIETSEHLRRVPDPVKITFPLMAITHGDNYFGVIWEPSDMVAAAFDSPDRIYNSGAQVMALSGPAVGELRFENDFSAHTPLRLEANKPLKASVLIVGGKGKTIVPAVQHYTAIKGLPSLPEFEGGFNAAVNLLAHGWLDSQINQDGLFRHAVWTEKFKAGPAADAVMFIDWLANNTTDVKLRERLDNAKSRGLEKIPSGRTFSSSVSHAHLPTAPFILGRTFEFVRQRHNEALSMIKNFDTDGVKLYRPGNTDYSRTHFAKHANGFSGRDMVRILEAAALSADKNLINEALKLLDKQTILYSNTVPRGAQTWEVPLHTPDILASAHMVKAYTLGYIISEKEKYLDQARYWAWTGVPFVYLYPPTSGTVGPYATIAVLGATNWKAPLWLGRPVQWCGLVYCSALQMLSECDRQGPWAQIAKGITTAGLQMCWPLTDTERQGLLPDFFDLRAQIGAGPAINPGTVQAHLAELYEKGKIYDVKKLSSHGWFIHAPCAISDIQDNKDRVTFTADGWGAKSYRLLISGIQAEPKEVRLRKVGINPDTQPSFKSAETEFHSEYKILTIVLEGKTEIQIK